MIGRGYFRLLLVTIVFFYDRLIAQTLHMCSDPVEYRTCTIVCITTDQNQTIAFYKLPESVSAVAQCIPSFGCFNSNPYNITQPNTTATALQFTLTRTDAGPYRCSYGSNFTDETLDWGTFPEDVAISGLTNGTQIASPLEFNLTLGCLYSKNDPTVLLHYEDQNGDVDAKSDVFACSDSQSQNCGHDVNFTTYDCPCKLRHRAGIDCKDKYGVNGYIKIADIDTMWNTSIADNITFKCIYRDTSDDHQDIIIANVVSIFVTLIIVCTICICCLLNRRCRSKFLRKKSKWLFTCPRKVIILVTYDTSESTINLIQEDIEIQFLKGGNGTLGHDGRQVENVKNFSSKLFNPYIEIPDLKKEHEGIYKYECNTESKYFGVTLIVQEDIIISSTSFMYWAHVGECLRLQHKSDNCTIRFTKGKDQKENASMIKSTSKKRGVLLKNIKYEDGGSYQAINTKEKWQSGRLTLNIVNVYIRIEDKSESYVALVGSSIKLHSKQCETLNIKTVTWKKSLNRTSADYTNADSSDKKSCTSKYALVLTNVTTQHSGFYFCEIIYKNNRTSTSGILRLDVVDAIYNVAMEPIKCSTISGNSIQLRYTSEAVPHQNVFTAAVSHTNQVAPIPRKTKGSSLLIERISKEHEGCYYFESDDGKVKSGVLTLSVNEVIKSSSAVYLRSNNPTTFRPGANKMLNSIGVMPAVQEMEIKENPDNKDTTIAEEIDENEPEIVQGNDKKKEKKKKQKQKKSRDKERDSNAND